MPSTAVPGSQAAINASEALICLFTTNGLPDKNILTAGIP